MAFNDKMTYKELVREDKSQEASHAKKMARLDREERARFKKKYVPSLNRYTPSEKAHMQAETNKAIRDRSTAEKEGLSPRAAERATDAGYGSGHDMAYHGEGKPHK